MYSFLTVTKVVGNIDNEKMFILLFWIDERGTQKTGIIIKN